MKSLFPNYPMADYYDALWFAFGIVIIISVIRWFVTRRNEAIENEKLFLTPEEKNRLHNDPNGAIMQDRNARIMESIEHDCECDVKPYDEDFHRLN